MKQSTIIKRFQALALARYSQGWDTFAECYSQADWIAFTTHFETGEPMSWREALDMCETCASVWRERQAEAASYYDGCRTVEAVEAPAIADDGGEWEPDDSPREPMQFIPHAGDYSIFD